MNRLDALRALAILWIAVLPASQLLAAEQSQAFKIGSCDWSLKMQLSLDSFRFAKRVGLTGIQYSFDAVGNGLDLRARENRDAIREVVKETGVGISSLGIGLLNRVPLATSDEAETLVVECIQTMVILKQEAALIKDPELAAKVSPRIVLLAFFGKGDINGKPDAIQAVIEKLKRLAPLAEKQGFTLGLETLLSEADHRHIIESVGSPAVKVYYDTANSARMGYDIYSEIKSLGPDNICEIHLKENGDLLGKGDIDFPRVKALLQSINYQGWLIIEGSVPKGMDRVEASEKNAAYAATLFNPLAGVIPQGLLGEWSLALATGEPAWLRVVEQVGRPLVYMRIYIGSDGPCEATEVVGGRLKFGLKRKRNKKNPVSAATTVDVGITDGKLDGLIRRPSEVDGSIENIRFTGKKVPPMPSAPNLSKVRFGPRVALFNGKDLSGWRPHEADKKNGWSAQGGMLVNSTTKTDFSPTGAYANLRTEAEFADFRLRLEFLVEAQRNSGIYLRGMYEAQVVDRDSRMQGMQGVGAIFNRIAPSTNAGRPGGEWQSYDLLLVDRHITVTLNGVKVIDNQPIIGPTAGAIYTDPSAPGPIYLQGDHTTVKYRNIFLSPVLK